MSRNLQAGPTFVFVWALTGLGSETCSFQYTGHISRQHFTGTDVNYHLSQLVHLREKYSLS